MKAYDVTVGITLVNVSPLVAVNAIREGILYRIVLAVELIVDVTLIAPAILMPTIVSYYSLVKVIVYVSWRIGPTHHARSHYDLTLEFKVTKIA
jgi:hypothetical protein